MIFSGFQIDYIDLYWMIFGVFDDLLRLISPQGKDGHIRELEEDLRRVA
jgi:hypothetical protein